MPFQLLLFDGILVVTVILGAVFHHDDAPVNALGRTHFGGVALHSSSRATLVS